MDLGHTTSAGGRSRPSQGDAGERPRCPACDGALGERLLTSRDRLCGLPGTFSVARCRTCGMGVTLPRLDTAALAAFYPSTYGTHEGLPSGVLALVSQLVQRVQSWQALHSAPMAHLAGLAPGRLLDVGCGRGDVGSWFVRRGWSVVGVEPSAHACAIAGSRGVEARTGALADVTLETQAYDAVLFRHSLEHVADPVEDLRRVRRALRDGGVAIVSVPNFGCWQSRRFGGRWFQLDVPRHRFHFNESALQRMLARAGFPRVELTTSSSSLSLPASIQYALADRCLFPEGLKQRVAVALCASSTPLSWLLNRLTGEGDELHAIAYTR